MLTSKACSEEGLEDVTALLLNLSYGGLATILRLILAGARELGNVVSAHLSAMLKELRGLKEAGVLGQGGQGDKEEGKGQKGVLSDRFTREAVVLTSPAKMKGGPEMTQETSLVAGKPRVAEEDLPPATRQFLKFAKTHRTVLNQILRQSTAHLADGPFAVLVSSPIVP